MFSFNPKWLAIGATVLIALAGLWWLIDDNAYRRAELARERAAHAQTQAVATQVGKEAAKQEQAARERYKAVRDAFREIENAKDTCTDSAAGRIALERVRQILDADGADRP